MVEEVAILAVNRDKEFRTCHRQHDLQLSLTGMSAHVHRLHARVDHLCTTTMQRVDDPAHSPLVTRYRVCADYHNVTFFKLEPLALASRHERKSGQRLTLRPGGHHADPTGIEIPDFFDVHHGVVLDCQQAKAPSQLHVLGH